MEGINLSALAGHLLPNADPPYKISIIARGMAGGFTRFLPEGFRGRKIAGNGVDEDVLEEAVVFRGAM